MHQQLSHTPSPGETRERVSVTDQLRAALREQGRAYYRCRLDGALTWVVDGEQLAPYQAAEAFLPGGWTAAWRRSQGLAP